MYFTNQKVRQGPAQLMSPPPKQPASYGGELTSSTITATSPETSAPTAFRAAMTAAANSKSSYPKDQAIDCGSNRVSRRNAKWSIAHGGREFDRGHPGGLSVRLDR